MQARSLENNVITQVYTILGLNKLNPLQNGYSTTIVNIEEICSESFSASQKL